MSSNAPNAMDAERKASLTVNVHDEVCLFDSLPRLLLHPRCRGFSQQAAQSAPAKVVLHSALCRYRMEGPRRRQLVTLRDSSGESRGPTVSAPPVCTRFRAARSAQPDTLGGLGLGSCRVCSHLGQARRGREGGATNIAPPFFVLVSSVFRTIHVAM
jgi:hypothetical protein